MGLVMQRRLLAVLLSIPLAAAGATGAVLHVCQSMGGVAGHGCDCEKDAVHQGHAEHDHHVAHAHPSHAKLESQPCCTVEISDAAALVATHESVEPEVDHAGFAFVALAGSSIPALRVTCDSTLLRERAPPKAHGPPLFVRHCAFLN